MSFKKSAESFSKGGKMSAASITNETITKAVSSALRRTVGYMPSAPKIVAGKVQRNPRAARNWLEGHNAPRAAELIELMREFDEVFEEVMRLADRKLENQQPPTLDRIHRAIKILSGDENDR